MKIVRDKFGAPADTSLCVVCETNKLIPELSMIWCKECLITRLKEAIASGIRAEYKLKEINEST